MSRVRVNIILDKDILNKVDAEAETEGKSRSGLFQEVLQEHLRVQQKAREEVERRRKREEAYRGIAELAEKLGDWDPVSIIRKFRDGNLDIRVMDEED